MNHASEILPIRAVIAFLFRSFSTSSRSGAIGSALLISAPTGARDFKRGVCGMSDE